MILQVPNHFPIWIKDGSPLFTLASMRSYISSLGVTITHQPFSPSSSQWKKSAPRMILWKLFVGMKSYPRFLRGIPWKKKQPGWLILESGPGRESRRNAKSQHQTLDSLCLPLPLPPPKKQPKNCEWAQRFGICLLFDVEHVPTTSIPTVQHASSSASWAIHFVSKNCKKSGAPFWTKSLPSCRKLGPQKNW